MKKKEVTTIFRIRLAVFYTFVKAKLGFMLRDIEEFIKFGITAEILAALDTLLETWSAIPTDEELLGAQVKATQEKDALAVKIRDHITGIMTRVGNKFGDDSGTYRKFGVTGVSDLDGGILSYVAKRVHRVSLTLLTELADQGLTSAILEGLKTDLALYDTALGVQEDAIADRDIATENRTEKANEIYRLTAKYCSTGKQIWESKNEAKFNDYLIYDTPSGEPEDETATGDETTENK